MNLKYKKRAENKSTKIPGFTLVEMLVALVVMAFVMTTVLSAMNSFLLTSRRLSLVRELQKEANFVLIRMSDKIRNESVDYIQYERGGLCEGVSRSSSTKVCLKGRFGFEYDASGAMLSMTYNGKSSPLVSEGVRVTSAVFEVTPDKDPDDPNNWGISEKQRQPLVTLSFELESKGDSSITLPVHTSISSRVYK